MSEIFKIGERIKCINAGNYTPTANQNIIVGNTYIVEDCEYGFVRITGEHIEGRYLCYRFVSLREIRKQKLEKLKSL